LVSAGFAFGQVMTDTIVPRLCGLWGIRANPFLNPLLRQLSGAVADEVGRVPRDRLRVDSLSLFEFRHMYERLACDSAAQVPNGPLACQGNNYIVGGPLHHSRVVGSAG
jgi:hypothetical protein